jgi:hypothetical protein
MVTATLVAKDAEPEYSIPLNHGVAISGLGPNDEALPTGSRGATVGSTLVVSRSPEA